MKVKVIKCIDPRKPSVIKYRLAPFYSYKVVLDELAENMSRSSSINKSDITGVIEALIPEIIGHLKKGGIVEIDGFGSFRLSVSSEERDTPKETSIEDIRRVKIIFRPDRRLKEEANKTGFAKLPYGVFGATDDEVEIVVEQEV